MLLWCGLKQTFLNRSRRHTSLENIRSYSNAQGSVVGPLLSRFFVNYFPHVIKALMVLFPDDAKMVIRRTQNMNLHGSLAAAWLLVVDIVLIHSANCSYFWGLINHSRLFGIDASREYSQLREHINFIHPWTKKLASKNGVKHNFRNQKVLYYLKYSLIGERVASPTEMNAYSFIVIHFISV